MYIQLEKSVKTNQSKIIEDGLECSIKLTY